MCFKKQFNIFEYKKGEEFYLTKRELKSLEEISGNKFITLFSIKQV